MSNIPGRLDLTALSRLNFNVLDRQEQAAAIRRLAATGLTEHDIAYATGLSKEMIDRILAERVAA